MTKRIALVVALALVLATAFPAHAEEQTVKLTGWITDEWCGAKNANAEGKSCAIACAKKGSPLVLYADGKTYKLSDQEAALAHVGVEVVVTGTMAEDGSVVVRSIEESKKKA